MASTGFMAAEEMKTSFDGSMKQVLELVEELSFMMSKMVTEVVQGINLFRLLLCSHSVSVQFVPFVF